MFNINGVLVIGPYTKADNDAASIYGFLWMGPKSTTSFILIVRSFICAVTQDQLAGSSKPRTRDPSVSSPRL